MLTAGSLWAGGRGSTVGKSKRQIPATTPESEALSKDLKRRGFSFVGPTVAYAYMQAAGMVNDHLVDCFRYREILRAIPMQRDRRPQRAAAGATEKFQGRFGFYDYAFRSVPRTAGQVRSKSASC
jgi:hypothetical protein